MLFILSLTIRSAASVPIFAAGFSQCEAVIDRCPGGASDSLKTLSGLVAQPDAKRIAKLVNTPLSLLGRACQAMRLISDEAH